MSTQSITNEAAIQILDGELAATTAEAEVQDTRKERLARLRPQWLASELKDLETWAADHGVDPTGVRAVLETNLLRCRAKGIDGFLAWSKRQIEKLEGFRRSKPLLETSLISRQCVRYLTTTDPRDAKESFQIVLKTIMKAASGLKLTQLDDAFAVDTGFRQKKVSRKVSLAYAFIRVKIVAPYWGKTWDEILEACEAGKFRDLPNEFRCDLLNLIDKEETARKNAPPPPVSLAPEWSEHQPFEVTTSEERAEFREHLIAVLSFCEFLTPGMKITLPMILDLYEQEEDINAKNLAARSGKSLATAKRWLAKVLTECRSAKKAGDQSAILLHKIIVEFMRKVLRRQTRELQFQSAKAEDHYVLFGSTDSTGIQTSSFEAVTFRKRRDQNPNFEGGQENQKGIRVTLNPFVRSEHVFDKDDSDQRADRNHGESVPESWSEQTLAAPEGGEE